MVEATSQLQIHSGHIALALGWLVVFGAIFGYERFRARGNALKDTPTNPERQPRGAAGRRWLRSTAGCSVVACAIHLSVIREHFAESMMYGVFFLVLAVAQFGYASRVLLRPSTGLLKAGVAASTCVVLLWLATRTIGIPLGPDAGKVESFGLADIAASISEALLVVSGLLAIRYARLSAVRTPQDGTGVGASPPEDDRLLGEATISPA